MLLNKAMGMAEFYRDEHAPGLELVVLPYDSHV